MSSSTSCSKCPSRSCRGAESSCFRGSRSSWCRSVNGGLGRNPATGATVEIPAKQGRQGAHREATQGRDRSVNVHGPARRYGRHRPGHAVIAVGGESQSPRPPRPPHLNAARSAAASTPGSSLAPTHSQRFGYTHPERLIALMTSLTLCNFRCFSTPGVVPLRPLTLLIGENSTGKTSFLAAVRLAADISLPGWVIDFNEPPFQLGSFNEIAHYRGGRAGRAQTFSITTETPVVNPPGRRTQTAATGSTSSPSPRTVEHSAVFKRSGSHPVLKSQSIQHGTDYIKVQLNPADEKPEITLRVGDYTETVPLKHLPVRMASESAAFDWNAVIFFALDERRSKKQDEAKASRRDFVRLVRKATRNSFAASRPICIAPVRTTPLRTYDPVSDTPVPEGAHIPMVLAKLFFQDKQGWKSLKDTLDRFGKESGLFAGVHIKALGRYETDPFQIRVRTKGPQANLVDVGYGVSQALPILVEALRSEPGSIHLMQQPEVHMHPRSQAALGSFLAGLAANQQKQFIVETHSDYLVDRVRMDIRDGHSIRPDDVVLLYFERSGSSVVIHPITIDSAGNLVGEPNTYREFFLTEERRLLGL